MAQIKQILVPTDFSDEANVALDIATTIAKKIGANLSLLHVIDVPNADTIGTTGVDIMGTGLQTSADPRLQKDYMDRLVALSRERFNKLQEKHHEINIKAKLVFDNIQKQLADFMVKSEADLIVMGSKGSSGLEEIFVGSNAEKVIRTSKIPVITVKSPIEDFNIKKIVFASDFKNVRPAVVDILKGYQQVFDAHIAFVKIITPNTFETSPETVSFIEQFAKKEGFENYSIHLHNHYTEEEGIRSFGDEIDADLLAMTTHGRTGLAHLFLGSIAEEVANHSVKPVLTFNQHFK